MGEIRLATLEDLSELLDHFETWDEYPEGWGTKKFEYLITEGGFILLSQEDEIAGHLIFEVKENPKLGVGEFQGFHVLPQYQGRGIGKSLIEKGIEETKTYFSNRGVEARSIVLFTRSDNTKVQRLYEDAGFQTHKKGGLVGTLFDDEKEEQAMVFNFGTPFDQETYSKFLYGLGSGIIDWSVIYGGGKIEQGPVGATGRKAFRTLLEREFLVGIQETEHTDSSVNFTIHRRKDGQNVLLNPRSKNTIYYFRTKKGLESYKKYLQESEGYSKAELFLSTQPGAV